MKLRPGRGDLAALAACVLLSFVVVAAHVREYRPLSPIDELQHLDYLYKAPSGHIVARGELVGEDALRDEVCRGIDASIKDLPSCSAPAPLDPSQFQERGFNTASVHPPTYYFLTGTAAKVVKNVLGWDSLHTAGRAMGAVWLALAVVLMWRLLVLQGASPLTQAALLSLVIVAPAVVFASSTISPDATGLFAGAALLSAVLAWEDERVGLWAPALVSVVVLALKFTHIAAIGAVVVYLLARGWQRRGSSLWPLDDTMRRYVRAVGATVGAAFVALAVWTIVQSRVALLPQHDIPMNESLRANGFPMGTLLAQFDAAVSPLRNPYFAPVLRRSLITGFNHLVDLSVFAAIGAAAVFAPARSRARAFAAAGAMAMVALGPVVLLSTYFGTDSVTDTPPRYGLPILPVVLLAAVAAMEHPVVRRMVSAFSAVAVLLVAGVLIAA